MCGLVVFRYNGAVGRKESRVVVGGIGTEELIHFVTDVMQTRATCSSRTLPRRPFLGDRGLGSQPGPCAGGA
jgi:hypothetical protein